MVGWRIHAKSGKSQAAEASPGFGWRTDPKGRLFQKVQGLCPPSQAILDLI
jgi:hypothetical protein